jgi:hypothetical protein
MVLVAILTPLKFRPILGQKTNGQIFVHPKQPKKFNAYQPTAKTTPTSKEDVTTMRRHRPLETDPPAFQIARM